MRKTISSARRALEALDHVVGTIHGEGFRQAFRAVEYAHREADQNAVKARGLRSTVSCTARFSTRRRRVIREQAKAKRVE